MTRPNTLDEHDVLRIVRNQVNAAPSQAEFARRAGISPPHLNMMIGGVRPLSDAVLRVARIKRSVSVSVHYEIIEEVSHVG